MTQWTELISTKEMSQIYETKEVVIRNNLRRLNVPMLRLADGVYLLQISELENAIKKSATKKAMVWTNFKKSMQVRCSRITTAHHSSSQLITEHSFLKWYDNTGVKMPV